MQQSINDSKISGGDRAVAWDGETRSGAGLQNQLKQIQDSKVRLLLLCDTAEAASLGICPDTRAL